MPVYLNATSNVIVEKFQDTNGAKVNFRIEPGKSLRTTFILTDSNLTESSPAPYYNPLETTTKTVTSTGPADDKTVDIELITKLISVINQSDVLVTMFLRATANVPGILCHPWTERLVSVGHDVDQIVFQFADAGTIYVEERK